MSLPKTFCPLVWKHFFVNIGGEVQVCCTSEEKDNNIKSPDGQNLAITSGLSPQEIFNLPFMKDLRLQLINGEWPEFCHRCKTDEEHGTKSRRQYELERYSTEDSHRMIAATSSDGRIQPEIDFVDLRLGSTCNLSCRMCSPRSSSKWMNEWSSLKERPFEFEPGMFATFKDQTWYKDHASIQKILDASEGLQHLHFAGGEPLIVPEMVHFLQALVERGISKNIRISYNTNYTRVPAGLIELWREFKGIHLYISIDAVGKTNDYIRTHSKWEKMSAQMAELDEKMKDWNVEEALLSTTVQALNVHRLTELFDYTLQFKNIRRVPQMILLQWPDPMAVSVLPAPLRALATQRIQDLQERLKHVELNSQEKAYLQTFNEILAFLKVDSAHLWPQLVRVMQSMDAVKKQNFFEVFPEFLKFTEANEQLRQLENSVEL